MRQLTGPPCGVSSHEDRAREQYVYRLSAAACPPYSGLHRMQILASFEPQNFAARVAQPARGPRVWVPAPARSPAPSL
jgi:hypothetical protein